MQGRPRLAVNEISEERQALWHAVARSHEIDEFAVRRLIRKADARLAALPSGDISIPYLYSEQAYLYAYLRKRDAVKGLLKSAEATGLPEIAGSIIKLHILYLCGDHAAADRVLMAADHENVPKDAAVAFADASVHLGRFIQARDIYVKTDTLPSTPDMQRFFTTAEILESAGVTDDDFVARITVAAEVVASMSSHPLIAHDHFAQPGEGILFQFVVRDSTDRLAEIDQAIDEALSERFNDHVDQIISFGVKPYDGSWRVFGEGYVVGIE